MKSKIINTYEIIYERGISQIKDLITHDDYLNIIKPKEQLIDILKSDKELNSKKISEIKNELYDLFGDNYFTTDSLLFDSINTGILQLPKHQGGNSNIKFIKIK